MPQHHLDAAKVRSALQQVGGKGMPEYVRRQPVENTRFPAITGKKLPKRLPRERPATRGNKEIAAGSSLEQSGPAASQIVSHGLDRRPSGRDQALLAALPHRTQ